MDYLNKACLLSAEVHKKQKYGKHRYYYYHVLGVVNLLQENCTRYFPKESHDQWIFNYDNSEIVRSAALLHDVVEDADDPGLVQQKILEIFPPLVYDMVMILTRPKDMSYSDYIFRYLGCGVISTPCKAIKLADLEFNIIESESRKLNSYEKQRLDKYKLARYILQP